MPRTPDRHPGPSDEEGVIFEVGPAPSEDGELRWTGNAGSLFFRHDGENKDILAAASGGISEAQHRALRQLVHFLDSGPGAGFASGAEEVYTYDGLKVTAAIWYTDDQHSDKIFELAYTYTGIKVATETAKVYDTDGSTVLAQAVDTYTYSGIMPTKRVRAITVY